MSHVTSNRSHGTRARLLRASCVLVPALLPAAGCGHAAAKSPAVARPAQPAAAPARVTCVEAQAHTLPEDLVVTGDLHADAQVELCAETEGRVVEANVERGQVVRAGEVLFAIDARDAASRLAEALATQAQIEERLGMAAHALASGAFDPEQTPQVRLARVTMERAEVEAGRYARLVGDGAVTRSQHDLEQAAYREARERHAAELDRAREQLRSLEAQRARVDMARKALDETRARAPWSGRVLERHVDAGSYVRRGERLATLVKVDRLRLVLSIPEAAVAAVQPGQKVDLHVRSRPASRFTAVVTFVGPGVDPVARALRIEAVVDNADGLLAPGLFATAAIELPAARSCVLVPRAAVASDAGVHFVTAVDGARAQRRYVQVGRTVDDAVEIVRGLAAGERIVAQNAHDVVDGALVAALAVEER